MPTEQGSVPAGFDPLLAEFLNERVSQAARELESAGQYQSAWSELPADTIEAIAPHVNWQLRLAVLQQARERAAAGDYGELLSVIRAEVAGLDEPRQVFETADELDGDDEYYRLDAEIALGDQLRAKAKVLHRPWFERRISELRREQANTLRGQARFWAEQNQPRIDALRALESRINTTDSELQSI